MDVSSLPYPDLSQFEQYGTGRRASRIYIGREFLKFRYHEDATSDSTITKQNYANEFLNS